MEPKDVSPSTVNKLSLHTSPTVVGALWICEASSSMRALESHRWTTWKPACSRPKPKQPMPEHNSTTFTRSCWTRKGFWKTLVSGVTVSKGRSVCISFTLTPTNKRAVAPAGKVPSSLNMRPLRAVRSTWTFWVLSKHWTSQRIDMVPLVVKGGSNRLASIAARAQDLAGGSPTCWQELGPQDYGSKPWYLVNLKIAGKWMFIPLKMYL